MIRRGWSLKRRLLIWLLVPLLTLTAAMLVDASRGAINASDRAYDRLLGASAAAIAERIIFGDSGLEVDLPSVALEMLGSTAQDRVFYRVQGPGGAFITGYPDLPHEPQAGKFRADGNAVFFDAVYRGEPIRVAVLKQPILLGRQAADAEVAVAQTRGERDRLASDLVVASGVRFALLVAATCVIAWFGISRGLAPLERLQAAILARSPDNFSPIEANVPSEVRHVVAAVNTVMQRLAHSIAVTERFIADASHQLRTPLAAIQTSAQLALRESDEGRLRSSVAELLATTQRTSRLATQLLTHARASDQTVGVGEEPVAIDALAADVVREMVPAAAARDIDLGLEGSTGGRQLAGDAVLLQEMLANLVDNALRHGRQRGVVTVRLSPYGQEGALVEVEDDGPGIAPGERQRVFERFRRLGGRGDGAGLGLAIVRHIVERHGGSIQLGDAPAPGGLLVRVELPRGLRGLPGNKETAA
jgi:two-component system sensor histidine kinase TctE